MTQWFRSKMKEAMVQINQRSDGSKNIQVAKNERSNGSDQK